MAQTENDSTTSNTSKDGPSYNDARRVGASALMFDEPPLARTRKTAEVVAERVVDALIAANITVGTITKPVVAEQESLDVST